MAVLTIQTALKLVHIKTRNSCLRCSSTGAGVDISWRHYRHAWRDSDDVIFVSYSADRGHHLLPSLRHEGTPPYSILRHCVCVLAVKTLFKYNLKETIHIYYLIKQYLKHEKIWRKNVLLKQKVMLISREVIVKRPRRDEQTNANSQKPASGCSRLRLVGDNILIARVVSRP